MLLTQASRKATNSSAHLVLSPQVLEGPENSEGEPVLFPLRLGFIEEGFDLCVPFVHRGLGENGTEWELAA